MAVETLSPDWEFDRVDDGSQSKRAARGRSRAVLSPGGLLREGSASWLLRSPLLGGTFCPLGCERKRSRALLSGLGVGGVLAMAGQAGPARAWGVRAVTLLGNPRCPGGAASAVRSPRAGPGRPCTPGAERRLRLSLDARGFRQIL